jgi:hypothetical protein
MRHGMSVVFRAFAKRTPKSSLKASGAVAMTAPFIRAGKRTETQPEANRNKKGMGMEREGKIERGSLRSDRRNVSSSFAGVSLRTVRRQVSPLRFETPTRCFGPSGDRARRFAKRAAQEEESKRKSSWWAWLFAPGVTNVWSSPSWLFSCR